VWTAPAGPPLHVGELAASAPWPAAGEADVRFRGYRLDEHGVPTFLYELDGLRVEETITAQAAPEIALMRHFRVRSDAPGVRFQVRRGGVGSFVTVRESDRGEGDRIELWTDEAGEQEFVSVVRP